MSLSDIARPAAQLLSRHSRVVTSFCTTSRNVMTSSSSSHVYSVIRRKMKGSSFFLQEEWMQQLFPVASLFTVKTATASQQHYTTSCVVIVWLRDDQCQKFVSPVAQFVQRLWFKSYLRPCCMSSLLSFSLSHMSFPVISQAILWNKAPQKC